MPNDNKCPRCQVNELDEVPVRNSLSRRDNATYICNACGNAEGMIDYLISLGQEEKIDHTEYNFVLGLLYKALDARDKYHTLWDGATHFEDMGR